ncbi:MAG: sugar ABC transporter permease [Candidatus Sumerlaea chitinivorans]|uniref:N-Acetyl-D-glucosamine ABC transport system, permease protein 1 n=1 Tax=Sumerlaea chitinivorans TaxID=2250252 RepID=A0A2Z4Y3S0_SUMC1|nr:N-Acetyl-D-glucosamine ABC transport system, permease protein 1 [Candidatus Sumerlaea chitinivorans]MCX7963968.1 sugar ABC transporter permease [Candidatus Sumerlaea chitinivorans]
MNPKRSRPIWLWYDTVWGYAFILPFLTVAVVFLVFPIGYSFYLSFRETWLYSSWFDQFADMRFVGLHNYLDLLRTPAFWWALLATFIYALLLIPAQIAAALGLALLLNTKLPGYRTLRAAFFLPHVFDVFVVGIIWLLLYNPTEGPLAALFRWFGIEWFTKHGFVDNPVTILPSIAFAMVLKGMGFGMVLFLTALNNIPESVFEAAEIDGANARQKLFYVTIPLLRPMILFMSVTGLVGVLNAFSEFYALTRSGGGAAFSFMGTTVQSARVSGFYLYQLFDNASYGHAAAMSFILLVIALVITWLNFRFLGKES